MSQNTYEIKKIADLTNEQLKTELYNSLNKKEIQRFSLLIFEAQQRGRNITVFFYYSLYQFKSEKIRSLYIKGTEKVNLNSPSSPENSTLLQTAYIIYIVRLSLIQLKYFIYIIFKVVNWKKVHSLSVY